MNDNVREDVQGEETFPAGMRKGQDLPPGEQEPMLYCPVCSLRLDQRKCKLFCQQCGYYMSCADYY